MKKKTTAGSFDKFSKKKSNAAIKEQFKQEKRKFKKEREEYFEKKKAEARGLRPDPRNRRTDTPPVQPTHTRPENAELMPLNKFLAHAGVCGRREAAEIVKAGKVKVNNELVTEPG